MIEHLNKPIPITMGNIDQQIEAADGVFMTEARTNPGTAPSQAEEIQVLASNEKVQSNNGMGSQSYIESQMMRSQQRGSNNMQQSRASQRAQTRSPRSRYRNIPTTNIKFQKFIDLIFKSRMPSEDVKDEIIKYVQALETSYTDAIRDLRMVIEKEKKAGKRVVADRINMSTERNELESLFIECIEEVRKEIMKRRLKNEIYNRKKFQKLDKSSDEAKEFEESLLRLAQLAKNRVKVSDFTSKDKAHILDLFVNNERTLLKIYEALFPHRAPGAQQQSSQIQMQPMSMMDASFNNSMQMAGGRSTDYRTQTQGIP